MSSIVKVDTIQENTSANGITVDGLNIKDSKLVTANSVVAANITADAIDATKIADGSIENEHLNVLAVTGHTAETSIADGDTILIHDASASALRKMTKANFVSGIGGANTPAWSARLTNNHAIGTGDNLLDFSTEIVDTNSAYNTSNKTFTVPSGQGGVYLIGLNGRFNTDNGSGAQDVMMKVFVNGSSALENGFYDLSVQIGVISVSGMVNVSAGDTINAYGYRDGGSNNTFYSNSLFWGYKLIT